MEKLFDILLKNRKILHDYLHKTSQEDLFKIPEGFNNNIWWNIAHVVVTPQLLLYGLSGRDFTIEKDGQDHAAELLDEDKLVMVIAYDLAKSHYDAFSEVAKVAKKAREKGYKVIGMSASSDENANAIKSKYGLDFDFYFTDETTLKTIVRSNPAILVLNRGTIQQKVHYNDIDELEF